MRHINPGAVRIALAMLVAIGLAMPAAAQSTGMIRGKVVDTQGQPVDGAQITIESAEQTNRKFTSKSNKRGEFVQIGLTPGRYRVTAEKEGVGKFTQETQVRLGDETTVNVTLGAPTGPGGAPLSKEEAAKIEAFKKAFEAGIAAGNAGQHDEAIARFAEALQMQPDCYACQFNIGGMHAQKKEFDKAEEAYKKAAAMRPDSAEPYNALANMYNQQKRFDEAAAMTAEAAKRAGASGVPGGNAEQLFNQGVILWNAGKISEAKKQFEATVAAKPDHAEANYWLGMANLNEGKLQEAVPYFEAYLKYAPNGPHAADAKSALSALKK